MTDLIEEFLLGKLTYIEVLDFAYDKLLEQGHASIDSNGSCKYRSENGSKCAIGHLLPDSKYLPRMEGATAFSLVERLYKTFLKEKENSELEIAHDKMLFLDELQHRLHDKPAESMAFIRAMNMAYEVLKAEYAGR